jgi:hypothetical protein
MSALTPLAILAFFVSPFALAGYRRAWRAAIAVLVSLAVYTGFAWSQPTPAYFDEQDQLGVAAWQMILSTVVACGTLAFAAGYALSVLRRHPRDGRN